MNNGVPSAHVNEKIDITCLLDSANFGFRQIRDNIITA
jgi:hypothetical protein